MKKNINQLLEKYWKAEASLQDEAELRVYFSSDDVDPAHQQYIELFDYFSNARLESTDLDVENILSNLSNIDSLLEKYWDAETNLEEEAQLKAYFSSDQVTAEHEQYKNLFTYFEDFGSLTTDLNIETILSSTDQIDDILEKYWAAETSLDEEMTLKTYFSKDDIDEKHLPYQSMFNLYEIKSTSSTDLDIEAILSENSVKDEQLVIGSRLIPGERKTKVFSLQKWATAIAAVFVLGFATISLMNQTNTTKYKGQATVIDSDAEAQEAYEITKEALAFLSKNMNKGSKTVVESVSKAEKVSIFK
ncbi:MAG: hypothetical protein P1U56_11665 [Saprospiraceae bacterium]|nr:hypothetical protein [Saprospiraceae bacterium]